MTKFLERKMKLKVNREKSKVAVTSAVKFLGMTIVLGAVTISAQTMDRSMNEIRELIPRRSSQPVERANEEFNRWYRGWSSYFAMTQYPNQFARLERALPGSAGSEWSGPNAGRGERESPSGDTPHT